jgi:hypothetical protein
VKTLISLDLDNKKSTESQKRKRESNQTTGRLRSPPPPQPEKTEEELLEEYVEDQDQITKTMLTALSVYTDHLGATGMPMEGEALKYLKFIVCLGKGKFVPSDDYNSRNRFPKPKLEEPNLCVELLIQGLREYWWRVQNWFNGDFDREVWEAIKILIERGEGGGDEEDDRSACRHVNQGPVPYTRWAWAAGYREHKAHDFGPANLVGHW